MVGTRLEGLGRLGNPRAVRGSEGEDNPELGPGDQLRQRCERGQKDGVSLE